MEKTAKDKYFELIAWRILHPLPKNEYGEIHHICPKSCFGMDIPINLVRLTPEEHYRCHALLPEMYDETTHHKEHVKMLFAWHMLNGRIHHKTIDEKTFAILRKQYAKAKSESLKGHHYFHKKRKLYPSQIKIKRSAAARRGVKKRIANEKARVEARCVYCGQFTTHD
jgi:hypothetical protein